MAANDYCYVMSVEPGSSGATLGGFLYRVVDCNGTVYSASPDGGYDILNSRGHTLATFNLTAGGPLEARSAADWTYFTAVTGVSSRTLWNSTMTLVIDMGFADPANMGDVFSALGMGSYSGTVSVDLP
ncbi:MAG: hypothetical protein ACREEC_06125 [Thermoplasmata archaeon]